MRRHTHALTALSTLTAAAALTIAVPGAASAQSWTHTDPAGDVYKVTFSDDSDEETEAVDPSVTNGDVISSTIKHNPRKVIATLRFRDLATTPEDLDIYGISLRTDKLNRDLSVIAADGLERGEHELDRPNGDTVRCRGVSHRIDYTANTVTMVVPRSCLGRPRWVKAGAFAARVPTLDDAAFSRSSRASGLARVTGGAHLSRLARAAGSTPDASGSAEPSVYHLYVDDALSKTVGEDVTYGPRLRRG